jgi:hypothetical protein
MNHEEEVKKEVEEEEGEEEQEEERRKEVIHIKLKVEHMKKIIDIEEIKYKE